MFASERVGMIHSRSFSIGVYGKEHGLALSGSGFEFELHQLLGKNHWASVSLSVKWGPRFHLTGL